MCIFCLSAVGNGDGSDLYFTIGNYDELLGRFQLTQDSGVNGNPCVVKD
jgi:hypothetical protein